MDFMLEAFGNFLMIKTGTSGERKKSHWIWSIHCFDRAALCVCVWECVRHLLHVMFFLSLIAFISFANAQLDFLSTTRALHVPHVIKHRIPRSWKFQIGRRAVLVEKEFERCFDSSQWTVSSLTRTQIMLPHCARHALPLQRNNVFPKIESQPIQLTQIRAIQIIEE